VRGDLIRILNKLAKRRDKFDHVLIETTGEQQACSCGVSHMLEHVCIFVVSVWSQCSWFGSGAPSVDGALCTNRLSCSSSICLLLLCRPGRPRPSAADFVLDN
jgi:hypothetical protein